MRRLLLFRHAKAERAEAGQSDLDRPLTRQGLEDAELIGAYIARHAFVPDTAIVSPSVRTRETFSRAAAAMKPPPVPIFDPRAYDASASALLHVLKGLPDGAQTVMLIGHNPGLHELALMLVGTGDIETRERLREKFPTAALAIVDFPLDSWAKLHASAGRLERCIEPKLIARATR
ncbi:MAG: Phosphohistidine phosphatase SixA [Pseudolabrys sp.]|jgi:phosphohistidine phosphatase|nr:Phosphohistidine phosphatase SixA [Pseudolabrys sp.]